MRLLNEEKAQGSIELLILVAAAVALAAIVGIILKQTAVGVEEIAEEKAVEATGG